MNHYHLRRNRMSQKLIRRPTCFISNSDNRPSSNPHALRIDHRRAQKSCNGAIYCWTPLLEHAPGKESVLTGYNGKFEHTPVCVQPVTLWLPSHICPTTHLHTSGFNVSECHSIGAQPRGKYEPCANSWATQLLDMGFFYVSHRTKPWLQKCNWFFIICLFKPNYKTEHVSINSDSSLKALNECFHWAVGMVSHVSWATWGYIGMLWLLLSQVDSPL